MNKAVKILAVTLVFFSLAIGSFIAPFGDTAQAASAFQARVTVSKAKVYTGPGKKYRSIGTLYRNTSVTVKGNKGSWYKISFKGKTRYMYGKNAKKIVRAKFTSYKAYVKSYSLKIRNKASSKYKTIRTVYMNTKITVIGQKNGYAYIYSGGKRGYVQNKWLKSKISSYTAYVTANTLNMRKGPGINYKHVKYLYKRYTVTVSGKSGSWYKVTCGNKTGYVKAQYIKKGNPPVASVAPATTPQPAASDNTTQDQNQSQNQNQNQTTQPAPVSQPVQLDYSPVANFTAYIGYDQLKVYQNSDTTSSVVATMREKSAVLVIGTKIVTNANGTAINWSRIRLDNNKEGYVKTANLETDINKFNAPTTNILGYGLDISHYQNEAGPINYNTIASGYSFITIKATEGTTWRDKYFKDNVAGALATNQLKVSYYHYFHATDVQTAQAEADWFMSALNDAGVHGDNSGYVFIDVEENGGNSQLTESVLAFLEKLRANGFTKLGIYTGTSYLTIQPKHSQPYIDVDYIKNSLTANAQQNNQQLSKILIWLSRYRGKDSYYGPGLDNVDIWQYTSNGIVAGVNGAVDKDVSYFDPNGM